eukprot:scaffold31412_cov39-Phaeocystis_antarctica.AAC.1
MNRAMVPPRGRMGTAPAVASDGALEALDQGAPGGRCAKRVPPAPRTGALFIRCQLSQLDLINGPGQHCNRSRMLRCNDILKMHFGTFSEHTRL